MLLPYPEPLQALLSPLREVAKDFASQCKDQGCMESTTVVSERPNIQQAMINTATSSTDRYPQSGSSYDLSLATGINVQELLISHFFAGPLSSMTATAVPDAPLTFFKVF